MAPIKHKTRAEQERVSKRRVLSSSILTLASLAMFLGWCYHSWWAIKVFHNNSYGSFLNNLIFGPGTVIANIGLSVKLVTYINNLLLENTLDADHKKYI